ncbi:MFS transporter [Nocardioides sp. TF02-7]|uniref:MFS transporter n=1 Tax=Nocardioides sp. TF02-7 TaxID=2917724 RepID=UPI001F05C7E7|nr:MFS transporter [Nocardioides sp. TF02-7]UMG92455.1 MFS transporter [Nocardioides sp. TF02-7]
MLRPTPNCATSWASVGIRSPTGQRPEPISSWNRAAAWSISPSRRTGRALPDCSGFIPSSHQLSLSESIMPTPPTSLAPARRGRLTLWAGVAIALTAINLRTAVTGFTPLLEVIGADLGFGVALAGLLGTVPAASFAVFGILAPVVTRRFGLERTATASLGLTALSLLLRAISPASAVLVLSTVLALAGIGAANVVIVPLVKAWFADRIASWTSFYLLLLQTGQFVAPLLAVPVADATTWRLSVGIWALPAGLAAVVWLVLAARLPADHHAPVTATAVDARSRPSRSSTAWGLVVLFAMVALSNYGIITWLPAVLTDAGGSTSLGGSMVGLYSAWGVLAALLVPQLAIRLGNPFVVVVACAALLVVGYLGMVVTPMDGTLLWVCALGIGVSTFPLCLTLINRRTKSPQTASAVSGFVQGVGYGVACAGPVSLGLLREATGSWTTPLLVLAATAIPGVVAGWFACRPRYVDDAVEPVRVGVP